MIAVLSPAKTLDYTSTRALPPATIPRFAAEAAELASAAALLSKEDLKRLMDISDALAELNQERFKNFVVAPERPSIQAFAGDVYTGLAAHTLTDSDILFAQGHLRILSGLYGLLRPLDAIRPYRLEMGTKWSPAGFKLTTWWNDRIAKLLAADAEGGIILNLASKEYWAAVKGKLPGTIKVIDVEFIAADGRFITMHAKTARGVMARWMIQNRITSLDDMRGFNAAGYSLKSDHGGQWTFQRAASEVGPPY